MIADESFAAAADGTRIGWRAAGEGTPAVVLVDGIACAGFIWREIFPALATRHRVLHWNYRGHGRSESPRNLAHTTLADAVGDLFTVMDAAGEPSAVLVGHSVGVQVCLEAHRRAPQRVRALALLCGSPGHPLRTWHGGPMLEGVFPVLKRLVMAQPAAARWAFHHVFPTELMLQVGSYFEVNRNLLPREDLERYLADVAAVDPQVFVRMLASAAANDATDHLPDVDVPTLVVAGEDDTWTPLSRSIAMHEAIPGSDLLVLPGGTHTGPLEHGLLVRRRLERFLAERVVAARVRRPRRRARPS
jgi:pimeloyl-ACP methyl ester carboxylesterase